MVDAITKTDDSGLSCAVGTRVTLLETSETGNLLVDVLFPWSPVFDIGLSYNPSRMVVCGHRHCKGVGARRLSG